MMKKNNIYFWVLISLILKALFFFIVYQIYSDKEDIFYLYADDVQYITYCENFISSNSYFYEFTKGVKDYTFRMPGMAFIYVPLRLIFSQKTTLMLYVFIQTFLTSISTYLLSILSFNLLNKKKAFYITFILANLHFLSSFYNNTLMTEALAYSMIIYSFYFMYLAFTLKRSVYSLLSGFFFTWLIFLRPYFILLYAFFIFFAFILYLKRIINVKNLIFFILVFVLFEISWVYRNFIITERFVPLQSSANWVDNGSKSLKSKLNFICSFGFKWENWRENSQSTWFNSKNEFKSVKIPNDSIFPKRTFIGGMTIDSLKKARQYIHFSIDTTITAKKRIYFDKEAARILDKFVTLLKKENKLNYLVFNRIRLLNSFLSENTIKEFITMPYPLNLLVVFYDTISSLFIKIFGFFGIVYLLIKMRNNLLKIIFIIFPTIYLILLFPIYLRIDESRMFFLSYPFLVIAASQGIIFLINTKKKFLLTLIITFMLTIYSFFYCNSIFQIL